MKKVIPFHKEIPFQTKIAEITDIEVTHNLEATEENTIEGSFLVNGKYKMSDATELEEDFHYDLPFTIEVDDKYDLEEVKIRINDFYFEIINEDILKVNVELELSEVKEKEQKEEEEELFARCLEEEEESTSKEDLPTPNWIAEEAEEEKRPMTDQKQIKEAEVVDIIEPIDILDQAIPKELNVATNTPNYTTSSKSITDMFPNIHNQEDTFKSYYVYIVRENDTLEDIMNRYKTNKEEVGKYNNLEEIKIGSKIIIPCSCDE